jgi:hypothetical protein
MESLNTTRVNRGKYIFIFLIWSIYSNAQNTFNFDGQLSGVANWSPENDTWGLLNGRYIPELNYNWNLDTVHDWYFEASANMWGSGYFYKNDSTSVDGDISAYRIFTRFSGKQYEVRLGLQKIDFGSSMILLPLQWFNEIDPRDPLAITDGVNAVLGRYYFKNNANIWLWGLYGNENPRGFDLAKSYQSSPELGGRFQYPIPKGEIALSYHHRTADATDLIANPNLEQIPEDRIGLDGKWDVGVGLWFEGAYIKKHKDVGIFTHQTLLTLGTDYTFPIGSGLHFVLEHLLIGYDPAQLGFENNFNTTAVNVSYPIGFFDNLSLFSTYSWETEVASFFLNYQHDFRKITAYLMAYYTPEMVINLTGNEQSNFVSSFTGPGLRLMLVFNH